MVLYGILNVPRLLHHVGDYFHRPVLRALEDAGDQIHMMVRVGIRQPTGMMLSPQLCVAYQATLRPADHSFQAAG